MADTSGTALAAALVSGERDALATRFDRHAERTYSHCFRLAGPTPR